MSSIIIEKKKRINVLGFKFVIKDIRVTLKIIYFIPAIFRVIHFNLNCVNTALEKLYLLAIIYCEITRIRPLKLAHRICQTCRILPNFTNMCQNSPKNSERICPIFFLFADRPDYPNSRFDVRMFFPISRTPYNWKVNILFPFLESYLVTENRRCHWTEKRWPWCTVKHIVIAWRPFKKMFVCICGLWHFYKLIGPKIKNITY